MWPFKPREPVANLRELERRMKAVELEWEDAYDRLVKLYRRLNKRDRDQVAAAADQPVEATAASQGMDPISARIWARRNRVVPKEEA